MASPNDNIITGVFASCTSLKTVTLPSTVIEIGSYAFYECDSLEEINLGNCTELTSIGDGAFDHCESLKTVTLPSSVTTIDKWAFGNCTSLEKSI